MKHGNSNTGRLPGLRSRLAELQGNMSTTDFAQKLGLSRQTVGFYLNGDRIPDSETLIKICKSCNVSADWLLGIETDGLGLSARSTELLRNFRIHTSIGDDGIDGLNRLIEEGYLLHLCNRVKQFCDHVSGDIELSKQYQSTKTAEDCRDYKDHRIGDDLDIADKIEKLISETYPEFNGRYHIFTGYRSIAAEKREIIDDFEKALRKISGYDNFLSELPGNGTWL